MLRGVIFFVSNEKVAWWSSQVRGLRSDWVGKEARTIVPDIAIADICEDMKTLPYALSTPEIMAEAVETIRGMGRKAEGIKCDVRKAAEVSAMVDQVLETFGSVDILINNAGILRDKSFLKMEPENWQAVMDVHLNGAYHVTRPAMAVMKENGYGRIVMTSSIAGSPQ